MTAAKRAPNGRFVRATKDARRRKRQQERKVIRQASVFTRTIDRDVHDISAGMALRVIAQRAGVGQRGIEQWASEASAFHRRFLTHPRAFAGGTERSKYTKYYQVAFDANATLEVKYKRNNKVCVKTILPDATVQYFPGRGLGLMATKQLKPDPCGNKVVRGVSGYTRSISQSQYQALNNAKKHKMFSVMQTTEKGVINYVEIHGSISFVNGACKKHANVQQTERFSALHVIKTIAKGHELLLRYGDENRIDCPKCK